MGTPATHSRREIVNAIRYVTVHDYFSVWRKSGLWEKINAELTRVMRVKMGKKAKPSTLIINSQTVRATEKGGSGVDGGKKIK
jgi:putative transposase